MAKTGQRVGTNTVLTRSVFGLAAILLASGPLPAQSAPQTLTRSLERVSVDTAQYRPGYGLDVPDASLPTQAYQFSVDQAPLSNRQFLLFDLNGDGALTPGEDGIALRRYPYVVRLPEHLLLPMGQARWSVTNTTLTLTFEDLAVRDELVRQASFLTDLRIRSATPPVRVSETASRHARQHVDYLSANPGSVTAGGLESLKVHHEDPDNPKYSKTGAEAGKKSIVAHGNRIRSFRQALWNWYRTPYHGRVLTDPALRTVGIAYQSDIALLYRYRRSSSAVQAYFFPPPGATDMPLEFNPAGEVPDPRPGAWRGGPVRDDFGPPIYYYIPRQQQRTTKFREPLRFSLYQVDPQEGERRVGRAGVQGREYLSSPREPTQEVQKAYYQGLWPIANNAGLILYIHKDRLRPEMRYRGELVALDTTYRWSFTTRDASSRLARDIRSERRESRRQELMDQVYKPPLAYSSDIDGAVIEGYEVGVNYGYDYLYFRDPETGHDVATYDYRERTWMGEPSQDDFDVTVEDFEEYLPSKQELARARERARRKVQKLMRKEGFRAAYQDTGGQTARRPDACLPTYRDAEVNGIVEAVRAYRGRTQGLDEVPLSRSLTAAAEQHKLELNKNFPELTPDTVPDTVPYYPGTSYEIALPKNGENQSVKEMIARGLEQHENYRRMLTNQGRWSDRTWKAMGVATSVTHFLIWLGTDSDPAGPPPACN